MSKVTVLLINQVSHCCVSIETYSGIFVTSVKLMCFQIHYNTGHGLSLNNVHRKFLNTDTWSRSPGHWETGTLGHWVRKTSHWLLGSDIGPET